MSNDDHDKNDEKVNDNDEKPQNKGKDKADASTTMAMQLTLSQRWAQCVRAVNQLLLAPIRVTTAHAARHPQTYIVGTLVLSASLVVLGLSTHYRQESSAQIWAPQGSAPVRHGHWIDHESNFPKKPRDATFTVHRNGQNIFGNDSEDNNNEHNNTSLALESVRRLFEALDRIRGTPRYEELCADFSHYLHPLTGRPTCPIVGATSFWNDTSSNIMASSSPALTNQEVLEIMSAERYPYGGLVDHELSMGYSDFDEHGILRYAKSFFTIVRLPAEDAQRNHDNGNADGAIPRSSAFPLEVEAGIIQRMLDLQKEWDDDKDGNNDFHLEFFTMRSFADEFDRSVTKDLPLIPVVFALICMLCIIVFSRRHSVLSRGWLGFGAVASVLLAILTSFGLLFTIGVPFTPLTPLIPFIIFGIGLDDAFIISEAYARTDTTKSVECRIEDTFQDIGGTILLTTLTSALAFALGGLSSVPAVQYLVKYAFPTVIIDFAFQITFFVAIVVIDERRINDGRRDCCFCCKVATQSDLPSAKSNTRLVDSLMSSYADWLLKPVTRWLVVFFFTAMLGFFSWRLSRLTQLFDYTDVLPGDSYLIDASNAYTNHVEANGPRVDVYFRDVDFADEHIQQQMEQYVQELAAMPYSGENQPHQFWLRDFRNFVQIESLESLSFEAQLDRFLENPVYFDSYNESIVRDEDGKMTASRTVIRFDNVDNVGVEDTVGALKLQRTISESQPINQGREELAFFAYNADFYIWEFYRICPYELGLTTITGIVSVSLLSLVFIPHWSAVLFIAPILSILYIDLLGFIELCGLHVNPVMYVSVCVSIGLLADFVMHVTCRFVESRSTSEGITTTDNDNNATNKNRKNDCVMERTKVTIREMGGAVLLGGFTTLTGILPLALSRNEIFWTTFVVFFGLVLFGLLHGLVLLPVLLSMLFGPCDENTLSLSSLSSSPLVEGTTIRMNGNMEYDDVQENELSHDLPREAAVVEQVVVEEVDEEVETTLMFPGDANAEKSTVDTDHRVVVVGPSRRVDTDGNG